MNARATHSVSLARDIAYHPPYHHPDFIVVKWTRNLGRECAGDTCDSNEWGAHGCGNGMDGDTVSFTASCDDPSRRLLQTAPSNSSSERLLWTSLEGLRAGGLRADRRCIFEQLIRDLLNNEADLQRRTLRNCVDCGLAYSADRYEECQHQGLREPLGWPRDVEHNNDD